MKGKDAVPITKIKALASRAINGQNNKAKKISNFVVILRIDKKHHACYFYWPINIKDHPVRKPAFVSKDPEMQVIEIHQTSYFSEDRIKKRLKFLDKLKES